MKPNIAALAITLFACAAAHGESAQSQTTSTKEKDCRVAERSKAKEEMAWVTQSCKGVGGLIVRISEADLRQTVSVGATVAAAAKQPAAEEGFGAFNHVGDTIEWRLRGGKPFATIQQWFLADNDNTDAAGRPKEAPILVVMRLAPACHIAYIDAEANPDAAALAQKAAEEKAGTFACGKDEAAVIGKRGRGAEIARP